MTAHIHRFPGFDMTQPCRDCGAKPPSDLREVEHPLRQQIRAQPGAGAYGKVEAPRFDAKRRAAGDDE